MRQAAEQGARFYARRRHPVLARSLRVLETWGPSPRRRVVSRRLPLALRRGLRSIVLSMHRESAGRALLRQARMARFATVSDHDYDPIRRMAEVGSDTAL